MNKKVIIYTFFVIVVIIPLQFNAIANNPPGKPSIDGPNRARMGKNCKFTISSTDPDCDQVGFNICGWGDDSFCNYSIGLFPSGEDVIISHTWNKSGSYAIKLCAVDCYGACSAYVTYNIAIIKTKLHIFILELIDIIPVFKELIHKFFWIN